MIELAIGMSILLVVICAIMSKMDFFKNEKDKYCSGCQKDINCDKCENKDCGV